MNGVASANSIAVAGQFALPAAIPLAGMTVEIAPMALGMAALAVGRMISPRPAPWLETARQRWAVHAGCAILMFVAVPGKLPLLAETPLDVGESVMFGFGVGLVGGFLFDIMRRRFMAVARAALGVEEEKPDRNPMPPDP